MYAFNTGVGLFKDQRVHDRRHGGLPDQDRLCPRHRPRRAVPGGRDPRDDAAARQRLRLELFRAAGRARRAAHRLPQCRACIRSSRRRARSEPPAISRRSPTWPARSAASRRPRSSTRAAACRPARRSRKRASTRISRSAPRMPRRSSTARPRPSRSASSPPATRAGSSSMPTSPWACRSRRCAANWRPSIRACTQARPHPGQAKVARNLLRILDGTKRCSQAARDIVFPDEPRARRDSGEPAGAGRLFAPLHAAGPRPGGRGGRICRAHRRHGDQFRDRQPPDLRRRRRRLRVDLRRPFPWPVHRAGAWTSSPSPMTDLGSISERRLARLIDPDHVLRPAAQPAGRQARPQYRLRHRPVQHSALVMENRGLSMPGSVDSIPGKSNAEDHVSNSTWCGRKARTIVENVEQIVAGELLMAAQALTLVEPIARDFPLGKGSQAALDAHPRRHSAGAGRRPLVRDRDAPGARPRALRRRGRGGRECGRRSRIGPAIDESRASSSSHVRALRRGCPVAANLASIALHEPWVYPCPRPGEFPRLSRTSCDGRRKVGFIASASGRSGGIVGVINVSEIVRGAFQSAYVGYYGMAAFRRTRADARGALAGDRDRLHATCGSIVSRPTSSPATAHRSLSPDGSDFRRRDFRRAIFDRRRMARPRALGAPGRGLGGRRVSGRLRAARLLRRKCGSGPTG